MANINNLRQPPRVEKDGLPPLPFYEGYMACAHGYGLSTNHYDWGHEAKDWNDGWSQYRVDQMFGHPAGEPVSPDRGGEVI